MSFVLCFNLEKNLLSYSLLYTWQNLKYYRKKYIRKLSHKNTHTLRRSMRFTLTKLMTLPETGKNTPFFVHQHVRRVHFRNLAVLKYQYSVAVDDRMKAMCDSENCGFFET